MNWIVLRDHLWEFIFYLFCFAAFVQIFYYSFFYSRVAFYREKKRQQSQQHPVSVIICAKDEDENIARYLPGVLVQKYQSTHEVIVVNDNSVDDSKYILEELQKTEREFVTSFMSKMEEIYLISSSNGSHYKSLEDHKPQMILKPISRLTQS